MLSWQSHNTRTMFQLFDVGHLMCRCLSQKTRCNIVWYVFCVVVVAASASASSAAPLSSAPLAIAMVAMIARIALVA